MVVSFFSPKTQFENAGDALINRELIDLASRNGNVVVDFSRCPDDFSESIRVKNHRIAYFGRGYFCFIFFVLINRLKGLECYYYLSPGGYVGELSSVDFLKQLLISLVYLVFYVFGVKLCWVGSSFESLGWKARLVYGFRSYLCYSFLVRDEESLSYLATKRFKRAVCSTDLAFNMELKDLSGGQKRVVYSFRVDQCSRQLEDVKYLIEEHMISLDAEQCEFVFYAQVERDYLPMKNLASEFSNKYPFLNIVEIGVFDIRDCEKYFKSNDLVVTNRLHVLLVALSCSSSIIPCVDAVSNQKIIGLWRSMIGEDPCFIKDGVLSFSGRVRETKKKALDAFIVKQRILRKSMRLDTSML